MSTHNTQSTPSVWFSTLPNPGFNADHDEIQLEQRILSALRDHDSNPSDAERSVSYSHFTVSVTEPPSRSLKLLRDSNIATLVKEDSGSETYALPIPYRRTYGKVGEQWWAGMSPAEARAGPFASSSEVKQAARELNCEERNQIRSSNAKDDVVNIERQDLQEGLRRQILHLPMDGAISPEAEQEAMTKYGKEWEQVLQELGEDGADPSNVRTTHKKNKSVGKSKKAKTNVNKSVGASIKESSIVYLDDDDEELDDLPEWEDPIDRTYRP